MALLRVDLPDHGPAYPFDLFPADRARCLELSAGVTLLVGENGSGKSTLLEAIAMAADLPVAGGADLGRDATLDPVRPLAAALRLTWSSRSRRGLFLRTEDFFGFAERHRREQADLRAAAADVERDAPGLPDLELLRRTAPYLGPARAAEARYGGELGARSHGESLLAFFRGRLTGPGLYLLDEPEAALSPVRQLAFVALVRDAVARGAQFAIATHAPMVMAYPGATLYELGPEGPLRTRFDDLPQVRTLRDFLTDPDAFLRHL
jgi:predicted ATPase